MIPGVQNPHWLAPVAAKASAHASASASPSSVVTVRPATRGDRGHAATRGLAVDQHRAAAALALRAAAVLGRARAEPVAQDLEQRRAVVGDLDRAAVEAERSGQEKLWPQPQVRVAFGFVMANPDWSRPSL